MTYRSQGLDVHYNLGVRKALYTQFYWFDKSLSVQEIVIHYP